jgi:iron complex transport system permease protein
MADAVRLEGVRTAKAAARPWRSSALPAMAMLLVFSVILATCIGAAWIPPTDVLKVILDHLPFVDLNVSPFDDSIVWEIRLPRVLLAALCGGTLAFSGAAYQGVFRNPLADPYLLGVGAGAGFAAAGALVAGLPVEVLGFSVLPLVAFVGAMAAMLTTYGIARSNGQTPNTTLILAGVAVSSIAVSGISYLMLLDQRNTVAILTWLLGGFNDSSWREVGIFLPYATLAAIVIHLHGRLLNVLQLDEGEAQQAGLNVERTKGLVLLAASLATAAAVSVAGIVGFVGLISPHVVRLLIGPDYRKLLPVATLAGATFLVLADLGARTVIRPSELPVGVITSLVGAPFFLFLLRRQRRVFF